MTTINVVSRKYFVSSVAGQCDLHPLGRILRKEPGRQSRAVGKRLVCMPGDLLHYAEMLRLDDKLRVPSTVASGHEPRVGPFVQQAVVEADGKRLERR